ncbi:MAG: LytR C-terminal domain-containing protein [Actinomycetes bacterium]
MSAEFRRPTGGRSRRRRPMWVPILIVLAGIAVLFAVGFGLSRLLNDSSSTDAEAIASASAAPLPCETTMVTAAEVLPRSSKVKVNVWNATDRVGLASDVAKVLNARSFTIKKVDNDPLGAVLEGVGQIRYGVNGRANAELLAFYFPGAILVQDDRPKKVVDIALGNAFTEIAGEAEIAAAMASPSPSLSGPGCPSQPAVGSAPAASLPAEAPSMTPSPAAS